MNDPAPIFWGRRGCIEDQLDDFGRKGGIGLAQVIEAHDLGWRGLISKMDGLGGLKGEVVDESASRDS